MEDKIKIAIIGNTLRTFGGGERWVLESSSRLKGYFDILIINPITNNDTVRISAEKLLSSYSLGNTKIVDMHCFGVKVSPAGGGEFIMAIPKLSA